MNYAEMKKLDIANGPGIGSTLFVSGCHFNCKGCFNKEAQSFDFGKPFTKEEEDKFIGYLQHPQVVTANLLGGEVFHQNEEDILRLVKRIKDETNVKIWMWTGYTFEQLSKFPKKMEILKYVDILIDGQFKLELRDLKLKYRGSSNQRVIDVQSTLKSGSITLLPL